MLSQGVAPVADKIHFNIAHQGVAVITVSTTHSAHLVAAQVQVGIYSFFLSSDNDINSLYALSTKSSGTSSIFCQYLSYK
jgi:hypothetical protein